MNKKYSRNGCSTVEFHFGSIFSFLLQSYNIITNKTENMIDEIKKNKFILNYLKFFCNYIYRTQMDTVEKAILNNVGDFYYKTPSYTRKAYKDYYNRNKEDTEFISKRKKAQAEYYQRNKENQMYIHSTILVYSAIYFFSL